MSKFKKEDENIIGNIGYPYDILPVGYPNKISNKKIQEIIEILLNHLKGNGGSSNQDYILINLGLNELNNRSSKIESRLAFVFSIITILISIFSLIISFMALKK